MQGIYRNSQEMNENLSWIHSLGFADYVKASLEDRPTQSNTACDETP